MTIRIVTDSACDLPEDLVAEHNITVVPMVISVGQRSFLDGVDISRQEFYTRLPEFETFPTTSVPGPGDFIRVYKRLAEEGASAILSIHISTSLSAVVNSARLGAEEVTKGLVHILDSRQLSLGTGFLALEAAKAVAAGLEIPEILNRLEGQIRRSHVFAALDTLEFLKRSGRVSRLSSGIGSMLSIKPLLKMYDGKAESERVRTNGKAMHRLLDLVQSVGQVEKLALVHTNAEEKAKALWEQSKHLFPEGLNPFSVNVTPVIGAHIGPGAVGFACVAADS